MGYEQIMNSLDLITTNSAKALNLFSSYGIANGKPANLIVLAVEDGYDALRRQVPVRFSIRKGEIIAETKPSETVINL
jgi:cytosine deaminase